MSSGRQSEKMESAAGHLSGQSAAQAEEAIAAGRGEAEAEGSKTADDKRRRRLIFRAWHRGIREMDLLLGQYADKNIYRLSEAELTALERIMAYEDADLLSFFTGEVAIPANIDDKIFRAILAARGKPE